MNGRPCGVLLVAALLAPSAVHAEMAEETLAAVREQMLELQQQMQELQQKMERMEAAQAAPRPAVAPGPAPAAAPWSPEQPISLLREGPAYINVSVIGDTALGTSTTPDVEAIEGAHHDPSQRGFTLQSGELTLDGAVDPYFKGLATFTLVLEPGGETVTELEEAWLQTTSLPWNLQVKAGQFFTNFGRHNTLHAHAWDFVDQPLVITRLLGGDGLRNPGAHLSWLAPTPFYTELVLGVFNSDGETAASFRSEGSTDLHGGEGVDRALHSPWDLLFVPRVASSFDLTETQTALLGLSGAFGPNNSGTEADTRIFGADLYWKWRPVSAAKGFPFVSWQTEALLRRYEAAARMTPDDPPGSAVPLPGETLTDWGFYTQLLYGFRVGWVAGLRGELLHGDDAAFVSDLRVDRTRISPNLTWYPTEFSKLRLQYNYDHLERLADAHSVWMQLEFLLGAHAAHKF